MKDKKEKKEEKKDMENLENYLEKLNFAQAAYYSLLKVILNDYSEIDGKNFESKIKSHMKSKNIQGLEERIFELLLYLNPTKENFKSELNMKYIVNVLKYFMKIKGNKNVVTKFENKEESKNNDNEILNDQDQDLEKKIAANDLIIDSKEIKAEDLFKICSDIFRENNLYKILFENEADISNKGEYIEMLLLFLPNKETQQIIKFIKNKLNFDNKDKILDLFQNLFRAINLKNKNGFLFIKKTLLKFIEDKMNFINTYKDIEKEFIIENKSLRCKHCFKLPTFQVNSESKKSINTKYKCEHIQLDENDNLKQIMDYNFKCDECKQLILKCYKNHICSNCKNIICTFCHDKHFEKCGTLFFIEIEDIDIKCVKHNEKYEYYCDLCDFNLCKYCIKEHCHKIKDEKKINLNDETIKEFINIIKGNEKNNDIIISAIQNIIEENNYKNNFQFIHFMKKILGINTNDNCKLFDELFADEFIKYYKYMINQINEGNYYYLNVLNDFINYYEGKKINEKYTNFLASKSIKYSKDQSMTMKKNNMKFSLLMKYFNILYDIGVQKQILNNKEEIKKGLIYIEENKILIKLISNSESIYQKELLKLIDRSIAENIIVFLIEKYPNYFKKLDLNLNMYTDLEKYYKNNKEQFEKIKANNEEAIKKFIQNTNPNNNTEEEKSNYKIEFDKPIKFKKQEVSVNQLNQVLEFLFYIKEKGNFTAHPTNKTEVQINPNKHKNEMLENIFDLKSVRDNIEKLIKTEFMKKYFITPIKPSVIFDCLFNSNFKPLIKINKNNEANEEINKLLNDSIPNENDNLPGIKNIFKNYSEKINQLKQINKELQENKNIKKVNPELLNTDGTKTKEFYDKLDALLKSNEKIISFLDKLNNYEYETSITGESYAFFSKCLDHVMEKILPEINKKIEKYEKEKNEFENSNKEKEKVILFLKNLNKKFISLFEFKEEIIDVNKINEYMNKDKNNEEKIQVDLEDIKNNLGILVNKNIDWTACSECKHSTLLFLKQNNY